MKPDLDAIRSYFFKHAGESPLVKQLSTWLGRNTKETPPTVTVQPDSSDSSARSAPDKKPIHSRKTQKQTLRKAFLNLRAKYSRKHMKQTLAKAMDSLYKGDTENGIKHLNTLNRRMHLWVGVKKGHPPFAEDYARILQPLIKEYRHQVSTPENLAEKLSRDGQLFQELACITYLMEGIHGPKGEKISDRLTPDAINCVAMTGYLTTELFKQFRPVDSDSLIKAWLDDTEPSHQPSLDRERIVAAFHAFKRLK